MPIKTTTGTYWVFPVESKKAYRMTCEKDETFHRVTGDAPLFNPAAAKYATSDMVDNLVANSAKTEHPIYVRGDEVSSARVLSEVHAWKQFLSLEEACNHKHLGRTMPSAKAIEARYQARLEGVQTIDC